MGTNTLCHGSRWFQHVLISVLAFPSLIDLRSAGRKKITLNDKDLLLIHFKEKVYAIQEKCPHYGK